jgi:hypothetical protein
MAVGYSARYPPFGAVAAVVATVNSDIQNGQICAAVS